MKILKLLAVLCLAIFLWYVSTIFFATPSPTSSTPYVSSADSIRSEMILAGVDSLQVGELVDFLRPMLMAPVCRREVENWYANKSAWIDQFGDPQNVFYSAEIIFEEYLRQDSISQASRAKSAIGRLYAKDGNYPVAIEAGQEAYELAQRVADSIAIGWSLTSMSNNFSTMQDLAAARSYGERALQLGRDIDYAAIEATALVILGGVAARDSMYDVGLSMTQEGLAIAKANDLPVIERRALLNISFNYNHTQRFDESIELLTKNVDFSKLSVSIPNIFLCFNLQGAYARKRNFEQATRFLDLACNLANEMDFTYAQLNCEKARTRLFQQQRLYAQALASANKTSVIQKKITGLEQTRAVQSLKTQMRLLEKDLEIEKLNQARRDSERVNRQRFIWFLLASIALALFAIGTYFFMRSQNQAKSAKQQKQLAETKLHVLQSQMHPHFVFNALGGIQNYILKSKKIDAYNYMGTFATLLRTITKTSTQIDIDLDQEIEFIDSYLKMEKLRFRDDFSYSLEVDPAFQEINVRIPGMIIQPVVENALVHGLAGLEVPGKLSVEIKPCANSRQGVCCIVTDNGRGRKAAMEIANQRNSRGHLSIATVNTSKRLDLLRRLGYTEVQSSTEDLYENGQPAGTRVSIFLPYIKEVPLAYA